MVTFARGREIWTNFAMSDPWLASKIMENHPPRAIARAKRSKSKWEATTRVARMFLLRLFVYQHLRYRSQIDAPSFFLAPFFTIVLQNK